MGDRLKVPLAPETQQKLDHLNAMIIILGSVMSKLGQMSDYIAGSPSLPAILQWQMEFSMQIAELRKLIEKDFAKEQLVDAVNRLSAAKE